MRNSCAAALCGVPIVVTSEKSRSTTRSWMKPIGTTGSDGAAAGAGSVFQSRGSGLRK
ncbi:hypothetical protein [Burkholderia sp. MSMB2157WGS]|uniref:hypothetical protein n=1 Tax=Burkholderia sp. MSMB2157WGS TaxID=1637928 RepID=UPI0012E32FC7